MSREFQMNLSPYLADRLCEIAESRASAEPERPREAIGPSVWPNPRVEPKSAVIAPEAVLDHPVSGARGFCTTRRPWTDAEVALLTERYPAAAARFGGLTELAALLQRDRKSVRDKARLLGLLGSDARRKARLSRLPTLDPIVQAWQACNQGPPRKSHGLEDLPLPAGLAANVKSHPQGATEYVERLKREGYLTRMVAE